MNIFKEFKKAGLIKSEEFVDSSEVTTTGNVAVGMSPFEGEPEEEESKEEKYMEMVECAQKLNAAYKKMSGKDLHELFCPKCKSRAQGPDLKDAPTHDGNQSPVDNTPNISKGDYGEH